MTRKGRRPLGPPDVGLRTQDEKGLFEEGRLRNPVKGKASKLSKSDPESKEKVCKRTDIYGW